MPPKIQTAKLVLTKNTTEQATADPQQVSGFNQRRSTDRNKTGNMNAA